MLETAIVGSVVFACYALQSKPAHGDRTGRAILGFWASGYCIVFFGIYTVFRIVSPEALAGEHAPGDGAVWRLTTVAWGATAAGSFFGQWVRNRFSSAERTP